MVCLAATVRRTLPNIGRKSTNKENYESQAKKNEKLFQNYVT